MEETTLSNTLSNDLICEIFSWLPVKSLVRFTCVSRGFQRLISHPSFIKLHFQKASQQSNFLIIFKQGEYGRVVSHCSLFCLMQNNHDHGYHEVPEWVLNRYVGLNSCHGLVCVEFDDTSATESSSKHICRFSIWNPATGRIFRVPKFTFRDIEEENLSFGFGYDDTSNTYKIVIIISYLNSKSDKVVKCNEVKIYSIGSNIGWRSIEKFPANISSMPDYGIYFKSNIIWLTTTNEFDGSRYTFDAFVVVFLDLQTEKFTNVLLPRNLEGMDADIRFPEIMVLEDYLSMVYKDFATNTYVIWQMKDFGNRDSW